MEALRLQRSADESYEYDPASDRWKRLPALPTPRGALAAAVASGEERTSEQGTSGQQHAADEHYELASIASKAGAGDIFWPPLPESHTKSFRYVPTKRAPILPPS